MRTRSYLICKRGFDIVYAAAALAFSAVPMVSMALAVRLTSSGPALFRQVRIGRDGLPFVCYKIRTMREGTPSCAAAKLQNADAYTTRVGRILRRYSLDETAQLINILRGDMSLIGPRPLIPAEREMHRMRAEGGVYAMRPGLSGLAQIHGRDTLSDRKKARLDTLYTDNASIWLDAAILSRTFRCIYH